MGKGKGDLSGFVYRARPGNVIFEVDGLDEATCREALRKGGSKLPVKTKNNSKVVNKAMENKKLKGIIVSDAMDKTVVVSVDRFVKHPKYKKYVKKTKRYKAHDEKEEYNVGETVMIQECRPLSKDKHFKVLSKI